MICLLLIWIDVLTLSESDDMEMITMYQHYLRDSTKEMVSIKHKLIEEWDIYLT